MTVQSMRHLSAGEIFREMVALIRRNIVLSGVCVLLVFAAKTAADLGVHQLALPGSRWIGLFKASYLPVVGVIHYFIVTRLMQAERMADQDWSPAGLLRYIGAYMLATLGMVFGLILLVVPGVIVVLRWSVYANFVIGRGLGPIAAIKASWAVTRGHMGAIFVAFLVLGLAEVPGVFLTRGGFGVQAIATTTGIITGNIYSAVLGMIGLGVRTTIYALLVGADHARYDEIFG